MRDGSGCPSCPAFERCTAEYRGSSCAQTRWEYQLGDPKTNYDALHGMGIVNLAHELYALRLDALHIEGFEGQIETVDEILEWLKEPWEG